MCLVSTTEEGMLPVARTVPLLPTNILHHRLDLMLQTVVDKDTLCISRNRIISLCKREKYVYSIQYCSYDLEKSIILLLFYFF